MMHMTEGKDHVKLQLEKYPSEDVKEYKIKFDILKWWKANTQRFSILSKMARDTLVILTSNIASEAAFSTGGRVLDAFTHDFLKLFTLLLMLNSGPVKIPNQ
ncbi:UNVERIFIED_CONTAM: putative AC transposase [Sesamum radiatum]|uniref:AC transposase n=1 Tax=Sesamum radiatum TaxID=300843 RepID=A0AAW2RE73_SESRA